MEGGRGRLPAVVHQSLRLVARLKGDEPVVVVLPLLTTFSPVENPNEIPLETATFPFCFRYRFSLCHHSVGGCGEAGFDSVWKSDRMGPSPFFDGWAEVWSLPPNQTVGAR